MGEPGGNSIGQLIIMKPGAGTRKFPVAGSAFHESEILYSVIKLS